MTDPSVASAIARRCPACNRCSALRVIPDGSVECVWASRYKCDYEDVPLVDTPTTYQDLIAARSKRLEKLRRR